ncbi:hypothetical protein D3C86_1790810 [compost metagenome]
MKSTIKIAFLATNPRSISIPSMVKIPMFEEVRFNARIAPTKDTKMENNTTNG